MADHRILITSDIHCTDLETWYGVSDAARMERWLEAVLEEHRRHPFDLILILGDISLDYHGKKTPFDKGYSTAFLFMKMYASRLPREVPVLVLPGNHEQFPEEAWRRITGMPRQNCAVLGNHTFILLDGFREALLPVYDDEDRYSPVDVSFIRSLMEKYPDNYVWLCAHAFEMEEESEAFRELVARDHRIMGLFAGHSHDHRLIPLGQAFGGKTIAQTGNFSYTMSGAHTGGFWGFRDLIITDHRCVSSYIMVDSDVILEEGPVHFDRRVSETVEYTLENGRKTL